MGNRLELTGQRHGRLTVLEATDIRLNKQVVWRCACDCGKEHFARSNQIRSGQVQSCGCLKHESRNATHGLSKHPLYQVWSGMIGRCFDILDRHYPDYGGRGIGICERWLDVSNFVADMSAGYAPSLTLDRIDNSKGYSPSNCRWASAEEQANNKRNNRRIKAYGRDRTLQQWSRETGVHYRTITSRLSFGWTPEDAVTRPPRKKRRETI